MKPINALAFVAAALISAGTVRVHAQTNAQTFKIKVPFNFHVGSDTLPAGTYEVGNPGRTEDGWSRAGAQGR
jgi:hypothetical protein